MDADVVHLHLEHRVTRRLLARFTAQGFARHDLARACVAPSTDPIPRVILLGRLALYGPGATRLHETLVPVTARWIDPAQRKGPLTPYGREAEEKALDLLETALLAKRARPVAEPVLRRLQTTASQDVRALRAHLEARGQELAREAARKLTERGEREARAMREVLETQKRRVAATVEQHRDPQLVLDFSEDERRQLEANRRHWDKRLGAIDHELATEPQRIRDLYQVRASRLEPVGLVYLWPLTG